MGGKGHPHAALPQEALGNVVDWPNTPGMNQALGRHADRHGADLVEGGNLSKTTRPHEARTRPPTTTCKLPAPSDWPRAARKPS